MADFPVPSFSDGLNRKEMQNNGDMCICVADSLWCTVKLTLYCVGNTHQKNFFLIMADNFSNGVYDLGSNQKQQLHAKTAQWIPNGMEPKNLMSRYIIISSCYVVQSLNCFWLFATPWIVERLASRSFINSQSLLKVMSILSIMASYHLISDVPSLPVLNLSQYQVLFPMSQLFSLGGQNTGASALVLPMNIQDWFLSGFTGLISLQSKGLSRVFSSTTVQKLSSLVLSLLCGQTFTSIHYCLKNHNFDNTNHCW